MFIKFVDYLVILQFLVTHNIALLIESTSGPIRGLIIKENGVTYYGYRGIPYAEPPTGANRFMPPIPKRPWQVEYDATEFGPVCPQPYRAYTRDQMSEDCLNLNVYVPANIDYSSPLPVVAFVHGGEFLTLSGRSDFIYGPQFFIEYGVIFVTFNYRLGALGFLSVETEEASGNAALKDILLALKWIKTHIQQFGGDPNNITLGGNSVGAVLVHYMLLTERTTGLITRAFLISGSALGQRFFGRHPVDNAFALGAQLNYITCNSSELIRDLRQADAFAIVDATTFMGINHDRNALRPFSPFTPVAEPISEHAIIMRDPKNIIEFGMPQNIPIIAGFNSQEGIKQLSAIRNNPVLVDKLNNNFELCIPSNIEYPYGSRHSIQLARDIKDMYFNGEDISTANLQGFFDLVSDTQFVFSIDAWIKLHKCLGRGNTLFYYMFDFDGDLNYNKITQGANIVGTSHADEFGYMFVTNATRPLLATASYESNQTIDVLMRLFTDFSKYGSPMPPRQGKSITWLDSGPGRRFLYLNSQPYMSEAAPLQERLQFWYKVYQDYDLYVRYGGILEPKVVP